ncbi:MAG TPA: hypothetical protein VKT28_04955 [Puia sp.]|nr:hypothetical protein [Puia sp.]
MKHFHSGLLFLTALAFVCLYSCSKNKPSPAPTPASSMADKIAGLYKGTGKYLPGNVDLGSTLICTAPATDYNSLYQTSDASINIIKKSDSTVDIVMSSGPFPQDTYNGILLKADGNTIVFNDSILITSRSAGLIDKVQSNTGIYDDGTKTISFSRIAPNFSFTFSTSCYNGLPYYTSFAVPVNGLMGYANNTIKRYDFSGTKQ